MLLSVLGRGQHGYSDCSADMQPYTRQTVKHCVFWQLSVRTSISLLSYSSLSIGLDYSGQPSFPMCINHPWSCHWFTTVHSLDHYRHGPLQTGNTPQELHFWKYSSDVSVCASNPWPNTLSVWLQTARNTFYIYIVNSVISGTALAPSRWSTQMLSMRDSQSEEHEVWGFLLLLFVCFYVLHQGPV